MVNKNQSKNNIVDRKWQLGVYSRRSVDDGEKNESYIITNQKALIESFLKNKPNIVIKDYYSDDGYTGTNFEKTNLNKSKIDSYNLDWLEQFKRIDKIKVIDRNIVDNFTENIYVNDDKSVEVQFRYREQYNDVVRYLKVDKNML